MHGSTRFQPEGQTRLDESQLLKLVSIYIQSILAITTRHKACEAVKKVLVFLFSAERLLL